MGTYRFRIVSFGILFVLLCICSGECAAQGVAARKRNAENKDSIMPFKSRWALKTNAVDWLLLMPNLSAEFDLFGTPYKHYTLSVGVRGNWRTSQTYKPSVVYNLFDGRMEFRKYFRTTQRNFHHLDSASFFQRLKEEVFTKKRFHPRYWRAYYWGIYTDYANFNYKFGKVGRQGTAIGLGLSGGFSIPLYGYRDNYLDLELGASVGLVYAKYDAYRHDEESNCYPSWPEKSKKGHLVPYPVVSDVRVAFVYRFSTSVRNKYKLIDYDKIHARQEAKQRRKERRDSISDAREQLKKIKQLRKDSIALAKQIKDSLALQLKAQKDSLKNVKKLEEKHGKQKKDSLDVIERNSTESERLLNDSLKSVSKKEEKKREKNKKDKKKKDKTDKKHKSQEEAKDLSSMAFLLPTRMKINQVETVNMGGI